MTSDKKISLTVKVLLGMLLGIAVGLVINLSGMNAEGSFVNWFVVDGMLYAIGKMFVNALKMLVVPLVFFSLICGVCGIGDIKALGRVGTKSFALYMLTTAIAIATAITIAGLSGIGKGMNQASDAVVSSIVAKGEGKLDVEVYNDPEAGVIDTDEAIHIDEEVEAELAETLKEAQAKA